jgi:triosephosphate isomerase
MNGSRRTVADLLATIAASTRHAGCDVAVCPPFAYLDMCANGISGTAIAIGAQDVSEHTAGAYTGEVSAPMLREFGCRYVLVGHSERRQYHGESDDTVARKTKRVMSEGLFPVLCVGETWAERQYGHTRTVLQQQIRAAVAGLDLDQLPKLIVAYEPVWAIGTGMTASPGMAQDAHRTIRDALAEYCPGAAQQIRILYGGSMKPENAGEMLDMPDIDGGLVGGASLDAGQFCAIVSAAQSAVQ